MQWLVPGAFAGLALLAGPLLVHLLARRNARHLVFPATHFVRRMDAAAVRLRRPTDLGLLLLRLAIVAVAVLAIAQPVVMTPWRLARWNARLSRAVVIDTSRSMPAPDAASRLADQETATGFAHARFDTPDVADGIDRAVRWLNGASPSRREIVIVSDFQFGRLDHAQLSAVPGDIGLRLIRAGVLPGRRQETAAPVSGWRGGQWQLSSVIDSTGTAASWTRLGSIAALPSWMSVAAAPADRAAALRALQAAASRGVPTGDDSRRVLVRFAGAPPLDSPTQPARAPWMGAAAWSIARSPLMRQSGRRGIAERHGVMVVDVPAAASALEAPAVLRAVILSVRPPAIVDREAEVITESDSELARWQRAPADIARPAAPRADDSDGRWFWAAALLLLAIEGRVRRTRTESMQGEARERAA
ncbi:MAG: BatA domain-containing protein [Vicinamibacterales bacterium]